MQNSNLSYSQAVDNMNKIAQNATTTTGPYTSSGSRGVHNMGQNNLNLP